MPKFLVKKPFSKIIEHRPLKTFKVQDSTITITTPKKREYIPGDLMILDNFMEITRLKVFGFIEHIPPEDKKKRGRKKKIENTSTTCASIPSIVASTEQAVTQ